MKKEKNFLVPPRWEIAFLNEKFRDRLSLFEYLCKIDRNSFPFSLFLHSNHYFIRAHLEDHFNRPFSQKEIMDIIKDKTWQWRTTSSQLQENQKGKSVGASL